MLEINNLSFSYRFGQTAFNDVSFSLEKGDVFCIYGEKDSGKTSLLHVIAGENIPTCGKILFDGKDLTLVAQKEKSIFLYREYGAFFENRTLYYNLLYPFVIRKIDKPTIDKEIARLTDRYGIADQLSVQAKHLSNRTRMIAQLIRCEIRKPKVCLLDDPTVFSMDKSSDFRIVNEFLTTVRNNTHIVFATSSPEQATALQAQTLFLHYGIVQQQGTMEEIQASPLTYSVYKWFTPSAMITTGRISASDNGLILSESGYSFLLDRKKLLNTVFIDKEIYVVTDPDTGEKRIYDPQSEALIYFDKIH